MIEQWRVRIVQDLLAEWANLVEILEEPFGKVVLPGILILVWIFLFLLGIIVTALLVAGFVEVVHHFVFALDSDHILLLSIQIGIDHVI